MERLFNLMSISTKPVLMVIKYRKKKTHIALWQRSTILSTSVSILLVCLVLSLVYPVILFSLIFISLFLAITGYVSKVFYITIVLFINKFLFVMVAVKRNGKLDVTIYI